MLAVNLVLDCFDFAVAILRRFVATNGEKR